MDTKEKYSGQGMVEWSRHHPTENGFHLGRAAAFGGAAICFTILLAVTQVSERPQPLVISIVAGATAIPIFIGIATAAEMYITIGEKIYPHYSLMHNFYMISMTCAGLLLYISFGAFVFYLSPTALACFVGSTLVSFIAYGIYQENLEKWWRTHSAAKDSSEEI